MKPTTMNRVLRFASRIAVQLGSPPEKDCWEHVLVMAVPAVAVLLALLVVAGLAGLVLAPVVLCIGLVDAGHRVAQALDRRLPLMPH